MESPETLGRPAVPSHNFRILQALRRIIHAVEVHSRKLASTYSITTPQLVCLLAVHDLGTATPTTLSRRVSLSPSTVVGILNRLEEKGLIRRERGTRDRRLVHVTVTETGRALAEDAPSPLQDTLAEALARLPESEQAVIARSLERVVQLMEATEIENPLEEATPDRDPDRA